MKPKAISILLLLIILFSCKKNDQDTPCHDLPSIIEKQVLRVGTIYNPTSYFFYKDQICGYDYELCIDLANALNVNLEMYIADTEEELYRDFLTGKFDLVAYSCAETRKLKELFTFLPTHTKGSMVVVQQAGKEAITKVSKLTNKKITVIRNSIFEERLVALNNEIGGGIRIVLAHDSVGMYDLIEQVSNGQIDYTIAYSDMANLYSTHYKDLDVGLRITFPQQRGWLLLPTKPLLNDFVSTWWAQVNAAKTTALNKKYFGKNNIYIASRKVYIPQGSISPYDEFFKKYATQIDWDWRLLAALAFHESRFDSTITSYVGAIGVMQLMPNTAMHFGLDSTNMYHPELNIKAGVEYIKYLQRVFKNIPNKLEQQKFVLASYNSGPGHILDAIALTEKYGKNPTIWYNNVEYYLSKKSEPEFYKDDVVKYGFFRGTQTRRYVQDVLETYQRYVR